MLKVKGKTEKPPSSDVKTMMSIFLTIRLWVFVEKNIINQFHVDYVANFLSKFQNTFLTIKTNKW